MECFKDKSVTHLTDMLGRVDRKISISDSYRVGASFWAALHITRARILEELATRDDVKAHMELIVNRLD